MKNKIGLVSGFMISVFVHFGILLSAFLFLKEQAPIQKELFHPISLNDYIAPQVEQKIEQSTAQTEPEKAIEKEQIEPEKAIEKEQIVPKKVQPKPMPKNIKNSQIPKSSKAEQTAQNNAINDAINDAPTKENLAQSLAKEQDKKEQDKIAEQIGKIISAYIIKNYPKDALRRNQSGSVLVSFNYNSSGVSNAQILQSSNIKSLDKASLDAIEKTKHLFPKTNKNFAFTLPVRFAIK